MSDPHKPHCFIYRYAPNLLGVDRRNLCTCDTPGLFKDSDTYGQAIRKMAEREQQKRKKQ